MTKTAEAVEQCDCAGGGGSVFEGSADWLTTHYLQELLTVLRFGAVAAVALGLVIVVFVLDGTWRLGHLWSIRLQMIGGYMLAGGLAIIALFVMTSGPWGGFFNMIGPFGTGAYLLWLAYKAHWHFVKDN